MALRLKSSHLLAKSLRRQEKANPTSLERQTLVRRLHQYIIAVLIRITATQGGGGISPTFGAGLWILDYVMQTVIMGTKVRLPASFRRRRILIHLTRLFTSTKVLLETVSSPMQTRLGKVQSDADPR